MQTCVLQVDYYKLPTIFWRAIDNHRLKRALWEQKSVTIALLSYIYLFDFLFKTYKELIIGTLIELSQFNDDTCPDVQFAGFVLRISRPANIATTTLQLGTQLLLRQTGCSA